MGIGDERNLTMVMDLYELTMSNGYFLEGHEDHMATFEVFFRKIPDNGGFAIFAGLEQVIDYIEDMHFDDEDIEYFRSLNMFDDKFLEFLRTYRFRGDILAFEEGSIIYPNEPILVVNAPLIDAQMVETGG